MTDDRFHLEGMGVMGCLIACHLVSRGHDFTWHDTDAPVTAWKACTGVTYPSGVDEDYACWRMWQDCLRDMHSQSGSFGALITPYMEKAQWCFYSEHPPHSGHKHIAVKERIGHVGVSDHTSFHLNAQAFVRGMREAFKAKRLDRRRYANGRYIVTHGFHPKTQGSWSWGWSAQAALDLHAELVFTSLSTTTRRPCLYMRDGYVLDYAYPVPGEPFWYLGTTLVTQKNAPKSLDIQPKLDAYLDRMDKKGAGAFRILRESVHSVTEGWRPMPAQDVPLISRKGGEILVRPQYGSGIRHWWLVADALTKELTL